MIKTDLQTEQNIFFTAWCIRVLINTLIKTVICNLLSICKEILKPKVAYWMRVIWTLFVVNLQQTFFKDIKWVHETLSTILTSIISFVSQEVKNISLQLLVHFKSLYNCCLVFLLPFSHNATFLIMFIYLFYNSSDIMIQGGLSDMWKNINRIIICFFIKQFYIY